MLYKSFQHAHAVTLLPNVLTEAHTQWTDHLQRLGFTDADRNEIYTQNNDEKMIGKHNINNN